MLNTRISSFHSWEQLTSLLQLQSQEIHTREALLITTELALHGLSKQAFSTIDQLVKTQKNKRMLQELQRIRNIAFNLHRYGIEQKINQKQRLFESLLSLQPFYIPGKNRDCLIIVFATGWNNFGVSLPLFFELLERHSASILFIKNTNKSMYCDGSQGLGSSIDEIALQLKQFIIDKQHKRIMVFGFSSGGYASLYTASVLEAERYVGFGIRTDWAKDSTIPRSIRRAFPTESDYLNNTLINLRTFDGIHNIRNIFLYFGDRDASDVAHAQNVRNLANVSLVPIKGSSHNVILELVNRDSFSTLVNEHTRKFSGESRSTGSAQ